MRAKVKLGDRARCKITGFEGIVECVTEWRNNCRRIGIAPTELDKEGRPQKMIQFDELDVERVKAKVAKTSRATGGPRPDPER